MYQALKEHLTYELNKFIDVFLDNNTDDKKPLFVFLGFANDVLDKLRKTDHLLGNITPLDKLPYLKTQPGTYENLMRRNTSEASWYVVYEEYLALPEEMLLTYYSPKFIHNPLYWKHLPQSIPVDAALARDIIDMYDSETVEIEANKDPEIDTKTAQYLDATYVDFRQVNNQYYVNFVSIPEGIIDLPISPLSTANTNDVREIEISDDPENLVVLEELLCRKPDVTVRWEVTAYYNQKQICNHINNLIRVFPGRMEEKAAVASGGMIYEKAATHILNEYWGYENFRFFSVYADSTIFNEGAIEFEKVSQLEVIDSIMRQVHNAHEGREYRDVFVTAPTGTGKSMMFQIPAIHTAKELNKLTLIISPLIGLMNDQVTSLTDRKVINAATINSDITPHKKQEIINQLQEGSISILYLSPETLLSRSDIKMLVGDRKIGLLVVDEAHIVTTWGKAFRPDYWYLGGYVQKLRKAMDFPIATFTATAIYRGIEDMYAETRDSLSLRNPVTFFGDIKRQDIRMHFQQVQLEPDIKFKDYQDKKYHVTLSRITDFLKEGKKVLVYTPYVKHITDMLAMARQYDYSIPEKNLFHYYGSLEKADKKNAFEGFKERRSAAMLATKAFGMGIDIPDIDIVYHFAPTGNVCDYIQEIGRAARDENIQGIAAFDFLQKDLYFVKQLHGISTLKRKQLIGVLKKIQRIGESAHMERNLLVSADSFRSVFDVRSPRDESNLDSILKTALLIIEKDFIAKRGFSPIIARPRSLFTTGYFQLSGGTLEDLPLGLSKWCSFVTGHPSIVRINLKGYWENSFRDKSFAQFKFHFYAHPEELDLPQNLSGKISPVMIVELTNTTAQQDQLVSASKRIMNKLASFCAEKLTTRSYFKPSDLQSAIAPLCRNSNQAEYLADALLNSLQVFQQYTTNNQAQIITYNRERDSYRIFGGGYQELTIFMSRNIRILTELEERSMNTLYLASRERQKNAKWFSILGILDAAGFLSYNTMGGENPEIYIRINSYAAIRQVLHSPDFYRNIILQNVHERHRISVAMMEYLFKSTRNSAEFWNSIEEYFLGKLPENLKTEDETYESAFKG
jgi:ATP-dependent DNA helicase RecQ